MADLRIAVAATDLAGHALPALGLAAELSRRGHEVSYFGTRRWRGAAQSAGLSFSGGERGLVEGIDDYADPVATARALAASLAELEVEVVVGDALTLTPGLAAELAEIPRVTLYPEVYPLTAAGAPCFSLGLVAPRTRAGAALWRGLSPALATRLPTTAWQVASRRSLAQLRAELRLGAPPPPGSPEPGLSLVATLPELEYPREWPRDVHVTGPIAHGGDRPPVAPPTGAEPLIVVAPSTVKDPSASLVRMALAALDGEPVRVLASTGGGDLGDETRVPANAVVADWIDYGRAMAGAALVICHGNHGAVVQALGLGTPVLVVPAMPDDAEHGARVAWAGAGLMLPARLASPRTLRAAARRALGAPGPSRVAASIAAAQRRRDPPARAADLVERHARSGAS